MLRELSKVEQRHDAVLAVVRDGMRVTEVAEKYGVGRQTVHVWFARNEKGALEGLADRSHRPRSTPLHHSGHVQFGGVRRLFDLQNTCPRRCRPSRQASSPMSSRG